MEQVVTSVSEPDVSLEREIAGLIVTALNTDITRNHDQPEDRLYGDPLGLDSIDISGDRAGAVQAIRRQMKADSDDNFPHFCLAACARRLHPRAPDPSDAHVAHTLRWSLLGGGVVPIYWGFLANFFTQSPCLPCWLVRSDCAGPAGCLLAFAVPLPATVACLAVFALIGSVSTCWSAMRRGWLLHPACRNHGCAGGDVRLTLGSHGSALCSRIALGRSHSRSMPITLPAQVTHGRVFHRCALLSVVVLCRRIGLPQWQPRFWG